MEDGPRPWEPTPAWETQKKLLSPGFGSTQHRQLQPLEEWVRWWYNSLCLCFPVYFPIKNKEILKSYSFCSYVLKVDRYFNFVYLSGWDTVEKNTQRPTKLPCTTSFSQLFSLTYTSPVHDLELGTRFMSPTSWVITSCLPRVRQDFEPSTMTEDASIPESGLNVRW